MPRHRLAFVLILGLLCSSCHHSGAAKRYAFTGRVVSVDMQSQSAIVDGDDIPGFMGAMVMSYKIKPSSALNQLAPGDSISADVVVMESGSQGDAGAGDWLENVKVTAHAKAPMAQGSSQRIPAPGEQVPDFHLTNQSGKHISLRQYRGKVLLITFIYTRCPFPDFCPRMSSNFAAIDKQLASDPRLGKNTHLLSISFDPEHDSSKVLRDYAFSVAHTSDPALFARWEFAAPSAAELKEMAQFFGLVYTPEGGLITHNLSTTVISPDGKIAKWYHGGDWQVADLIKDVSDAAASRPGL